MTMNNSISNKSIKSEKLINCYNEIESLLTTLNNKTIDNSLKSIVDEVKDKIECIRNIQPDLSNSYTINDDKMSFNCTEPIKFNNLQNKKEMDKSLNN